MVELKFVDVGEGITEGRIQKWLVNDGDTVKEDEPVVQIETDKAVVNIPAPVSGEVSIKAKEGVIVKVGDVLANIGGEAEQKTQSASSQQQQAQPQQQGPAHQDATQPQQHQEQKQVLATPAVRKMARDLHIDIPKVTGTGPQGRVLENDLRSYSTQGQAAPKFSEVLEEQHSEEVERIPMSQTRKAIAKNMEASWVMPRAVHGDEADATALFRVVSKEKEKAKAQFGVHLTFLPYIIKATIEALKEQPNFNASYDSEKQEIIRKKYYNIGLAAEADDGLKVIVIKNADRLSILDMARKIQALAGKIKDKTISIDDMRDGTFTITNIGSVGQGTWAVAMINPPEVAILAVNAIRDAPVVSEGMVKIGKVLPFSITFDHRVVDGSEAVKFGTAFKKYIEDLDFLEML